MSARRVLGDILGAFSDGAILFPLLVLLERSQGFSIGKALLSTGILYIASAAYFRVPISVQPLKSIAVASVAVGATFTEIRICAFLLGAACLVGSFFDVNRLARRVPEAVIHQLQVGLGVLLVTQGFHADFGSMSFLLAALMIALPEIKGIPVLGLIAAGGLAYALSAATPGGANSSEAVSGALRPGLIFSLLIPQLVLTSANSVLATRNVCERYFGREGASRVTVKRLLVSIGLGNIAVSLFGGMPFCHGSGGVTAHVRGGSTRAWSTAFMGGVLILLAAGYFLRGGGRIEYPPVLIASLLVATGYFHFKLALPTAKSRLGAMKLLVALGLAFWTRNLLWVCAGAVVLELLSYKWNAKEVRV